MKAIQDRQTCDVEAEPSNMDFDTPRKHLGRLTQVKMCLLCCRTAFYTKILNILQSNKIMLVYFIDIIVLDR